MVRVSTNQLYKQLPNYCGECGVRASVQSYPLACIAVDLTNLHPRKSEWIQSGKRELILYLSASRCQN